MSKKPSLKELRTKIDEIDTQIVSLLKERFLIAKEIGKIKEEQGDPTFDHFREKEVLNRVLGVNEGVFPEDTLRVIYSEIIRACRGAQEKPKVAFLGPEATFSHIAAQHYFGTSAQFIPCLLYTSPSPRD